MNINLQISAYTNSFNDSAVKGQSGINGPEKPEFRLDPDSDGSSGPNSSRATSGIDEVQLSHEAQESATAFKNEKELTEGERQTIQELKARDQEVRAHEQAHRAAGGQHVKGGTSYQYQRGPDGVMYAIGGEVQVDTAPVPNNPAATAEKMSTIRRAALAPANPSAQDRRVAAEATRREFEARAEKIEKSDDSNHQLITELQGNTELETARFSSLDENTLPGSILEIVA